MSPWRSHLRLLRRRETASLLFALLLVATLAGTARRGGAMPPSEAVTVLRNAQGIEVGRCSPD